MHFPVTEGIVRRRVTGEVKAVDGVDFTVAPRRDTGPGRRERLRQDHDRPLHSAPGTSDRRRNHLRRRRYRDVGAARRCCAFRQRIQVIFQDPYSSLNPRMKIGDDHRRTDARAWDRARRGEARRARAGVAVGLRAQSEFRRSLSARNVRRSAAACRHRAGVGDEPRIHRLRRAGFGAGCFDPGPGGESAGGFAGEVRADVFVHRA